MCKLEIDKSAFVILPPELLTELGVTAGDSIFLEPNGAGGFTVTVETPRIDPILEAAEQVMDENRDALQKLA